MSNKLVLVLNCGSSSLKFAVINANDGDEVISGLAECFNLPDARIKWKVAGKKGATNLPPNSAHSAAISYIVEEIIKKEKGLAEQFAAVGHRIVHGGEKFTQSVIIDDEVLEGIEECASLAPLHNPAHILGIKAAQAAFPSLPQIAVFDTAFHQTMPAKAFMYALPYSLYKEEHVRRYGMHGTSHLFVTHEAAKALNKPLAETNIISAHLGNGASVSAIKNGQCVDTSMGMTPLAGLVMGTRCGDIDPSIIEYIASYAVPLERIDAIVFTGGIGENSHIVRAKVLELLTIFGYQVDDEKNAAARLGEQGIITADNSPVAMVIPTNEEWVIAQDSVKLASA
jgi:acetate kinase